VLSQELLSLKSARELVGALSQHQIASLPTLIARCVQDPAFLLPELLPWVHATKHAQLKSVWPPAAARRPPLPEVGKVKSEIKSAKGSIAQQVLAPGSGSLSGKVKKTGEILAAKPIVAVQKKEGTLKFTSKR
jgi:hypothetical protein